MPRRDAPRTADPSTAGGGVSPAQPVLLLTGFEPFDRDDVNPSWELATAWHGQRIGPYRVVAACLPVAYGASLAELDRLLRAHRPSRVICTGLAANRTAIGFERVAVNLDDARIADNAGQQPRDRAVVPGGPVAFLSPLPVKAMAAAARACGARAEVSHTAGTFVCNHVFYGLLWRLARRRSLRGVKGGFIHIPWPADRAPAGAAVRSDMSMDTVVQALGCALSVDFDAAEDATLPGGAVA